MGRLFIIAAAYLTMACGFAATDGEVIAGLRLSDLTAAEAEMVSERFGAEYAEARQTGVAAEDLLGFARCDLNDVPPDELIALGQGPGACVASDGGAARCGAWALAIAPEGWLEVLETVGRLRLSSSRTNGWTDLVVERGGAPAVFKYDGVSYGEDAGAISVAPTALAPWGIGLDQEGLSRGADIPWFSVEDVMPQTAESLFLWFYVNRVPEEEETAGALPTDFMVGLVDLDGAEPLEVAIRAVSAPLCGLAGCRHWLYRPTDGGGPPERLAALDGFDLRVARTGAMGMRDLLARSGDGVVVWRHDGERYALSYPHGGPREAPEAARRRP